MDRTGSKHHVNMFRRKQCFAPFQPMKRGVFVLNRETPGIKFRKRK